ncbi:MAG: CBS domain-containing protein, partial [Anaerolineales bacterium]
MKSVREVMTSDVVTLGRESSVAAAMQAMLTHGITGIPVVEGRRVVGIVTARDLLGQALYRLVGGVMTGEVATIAPDASITDAYLL